MDISMCEITDEVLENLIFEDAWCTYKRKKREKEHAELGKQYQKNRMNYPQQQEQSTFQTKKWIVKNSSSRKYQ